MAGTFKFHSKFHRASHHTLSGTNVPEQGLDPIASERFPFQGIFYNTLTDRLRTFNLQTNSYDWWAAYSTVRSLSSNWAPTLSLYNTVTSLSNNWNLGYDAYLTFRANSAQYETTYTTICGNSAAWNSPYFMFTNIAQEYTAAKTFSGTDLSAVNVEGLETVYWNLENNQSTFYTLTAPVFFENPTSGKKGGLYTLTLLQDAVGGHDISFNTAYRFNNIVPGDPVTTGVINLTPNYRTVITFVSNGLLMFGDVTTYPE